METIISYFKFDKNKQMNKFFSFPSEATSPLTDMSLLVKTQKDSFERKKDIGRQM